ncbi:RVT_3 domain-containing protein [Cephalotus follicularis]|uniref:RVT_3 domain-containing protein n=1 Tax=Cephalotus follicularis TaxID=3775 RepID=A0A1Q3C0I6_CEPFO|nr:RVT_3 domain-containing protein [Cephalotus follicularis]
MELDNSSKIDPPSTLLVPSRRCPPPHRALMINCDGALFESREGRASMVVKDVQGTVVMAASTKFQYTNDPPTIEVLSILQAMKLASRNGWRRIVVESDAEAVVTYIRTEIPCLTLYGNIV